MAQRFDVDVKLRFSTRQVEAMDYYREQGFDPRTRSEFIRDAVSHYLVNCEQGFGPMPAPRKRRAKR